MVVSDDWNVIVTVSAMSDVVTASVTSDVVTAPGRSLIAGAGTLAVAATVDAAIVDPDEMVAAPTLDVTAIGDGETVTPTDTPPE